LYIHTSPTSQTSLHLSNRQTLTQALPSFHPPAGAGEAFPKSYTKELRQRMVEAGKINPTGCPEYF
jgi:hypothetical protein